MRKSFAIRRYSDRTGWVTFRIFAKDSFDANSRADDMFRDLQQRLYLEVNKGKFMTIDQQIEKLNKDIEKKQRSIDRMIKAEEDRVKKAAERVEKLRTELLKNGIIPTA